MNGPRQRPTQTLEEQLWALTEEIARTRVRLINGRPWCMFCLPETTPDGVHLHAEQCTIARLRLLHHHHQREASAWRRDDWNTGY